jgi:hypothetical protein
VFKFLPGIILVQLITVGLTVTAFVWSDEFQLVLVMGLFGLVVSLLASFWFSSIGRDIYNEMLARVRENHIREKEQLIVDTEREKAKIVNESYKVRDAEIRRAYAKANFKVGVIVTLGATAGIVLIFTQLVTVGLTALIASGSALMGYLARVRQERISREVRILNPEHQIEKPRGRKLLQPK